MTITTLFGPEEITTKPRTIKFKQIKAVYETITVKEDIKEAGEIMGIKVLDHIIVGDDEYLSFVERGLL